MKRKFYMLGSVLLIISVCLVTRDLLNLVELDNNELFRSSIFSLKIQHTLNTGMNFGILSERGASHPVLIAGIGLVFSFIISVWGYFSSSSSVYLGSILFAGGGISNSVERLLYGSVFDYLNIFNAVINNQFSFNIADISIFIGFILIITKTYKTHPETG